MAILLAGAFLLVFGRHRAMATGIFSRDCCSISPPTSSSGDFSGLVALDSGRKLYLECRGTGQPTVIFESGLRTRGDNWTRADLLRSPGKPVFQEVAKFARVCTYDRPGTTVNPGETSRSSAVRMPRTALDAVRDLHGLLLAAHITPPYIMVGHSFGGLFVRLYAAEYPKEIRGLVLDDALAEYLRPLLAQPDWNLLVELNNGPLPGFENYHDLEAIDFDESFAQMRAALKQEPQQRMPVVVLVRGLPVELPASAPAAFGPVLEQAWRRSEDELAASIPRAKRVIAARSGHYIQFDEPQVIVQAIRDVFQAVRLVRESVFANHP